MTIRLTHALIEQRLREHARWHEAETNRLYREAIEEVLFDTPPPRPRSLVIDFPSPDPEPRRCNARRRP